MRRARVKASMAKPALSARVCGNQGGSDGRPIGSVPEINPSEMWHAYRNGSKE